jgi:hypothetical protein
VKRAVRASSVALLMPLAKDLAASFGRSISSAATKRLPLRGAAADVGQT